LRGLAGACAAPARAGYVLLPIGDLHEGPPRSQTDARWLPRRLLRRLSVSSVAWSGAALVGHGRDARNKFWASDAPRKAVL